MNALAVLTVEAEDVLSLLIEGAPIEPDQVLPGQLDPAPELSSEERLMLAVVWQALIDTMSSRSSVCRAAERYLHHPSSSHAFALEGIATHFGWDVATFRRRARSEPVRQRLAAMARLKANPRWEKRRVLAGGEKACGGS